MPVHPAPGQGSLFAIEPPGLETFDGCVSGDEEHELLTHIESLRLTPFEFQGWSGKRETISFGWRYDFNEARVHQAEPIPAFLLPLRERAAQLAALPAHALEQALIIRYGVGAGIGWHRDRPVFDRVVGISLKSACVLRFRRREGRGFRRFSLPSPARAAYLLRGEIRHEWEHSIAPLERERYSITFRNRSQA